MGEHAGTKSRRAPRNGHQVIYAQFFMKGLDGKTIEATGDRSVIILDGRVNRTTHQQWAQEECASRGYMAWQLMKGPRFTDSWPIGEITEV